MLARGPNAALRLAATLGLAATLSMPGIVTGALPAPGTGPVTPAADLAQPHADDVVLVTYRERTDTGKRDAARRSVGASSARQLSPLAPDAERIQLGGGVSVERAIAILKANPVVQAVEPDYLLTSQDVSNDPYYTGGSLWGMEGDSSPLHTNPYGSAAAEAWQAGYTGSRSVVVGVIDEGLQHTHPDLAANIWTNPGEIAGNGLDDDGNGYIDDVHGWDFFNDDASTFDGTATDGYDSHGTHVSGTIGGVGGNGTGVAGVNWQVTIISAKFLGPNGGYSSDAVRALDYLTDLKLNHGVNLVASSNSWGGGGYSSSLLAAINRGGDAGMLFVAAAGNNGADNDSTARYPTNYECTNGGTRGWDCMISVAAISSSGAKASFSNWGASTVDLGAPGVSVMSTLPTNSYGSYSGTSMATPHVSGAVALCKSINPGLSAAQIRFAVLSSAAPTTSLVGLTVTGGRLDIGAMVPLCAPSDAPVSGGPGSSLTATGVSPSQIDLAWTDGATNESNWEVQQSPAGCTSWSTVGQTGADATSFQATGLAADATYCFRVRATNAHAGGTASPWSNEAVGQTLALPPSYDCISTPYAWIDATAGGTSHALGDDASVIVALPFSFPFYGATATSVEISSNGYLLLTGGNGSAFANSSIPDATDPNGFVAAFWDDLNPSIGGQVWTRTVGSAPNRQFVAAWVGVARFGVSNNAVTFEIVLHETTGAITLQYQDVVAGRKSYDYGKSATVGIENPTGTSGTLISYNSPSLSNASAWRCAGDGTPPALAVVTTSLPDGTVSASYSAQLEASGGQAPYSWSIVSGTLPAGLSLDPSSGVISGTATVATTSAFTVQVTDAGNPAGSAARVLSITVNPSGGSTPGSFGKVDPTNNTKLSSPTVSLNWGTSAGATTYEFCVSTSNGTCLGGWTATSGTSADISGLDFRVNYWWQVRAVNASGTTDADGGSWWKFSVR